MTWIFLGDAVDLIWNADDMDFFWDAVDLIWNTDDADDADFYVG